MATFIFALAISGTTVLIRLAAAAFLFGILHLLWIRLGALGHQSQTRLHEKPPKDLVNDLSETFPPSRRHILTQVADSTIRVLGGGSVGDVSRTRPQSLLETHSDYRLADSARLLYSGFTVGEVRSLGDFPDYAKLSGVPLPAPAVNFRIDTALPRPYRPFRWPYHQTMALQKLDSDYWLELESTYRERIRDRQALFIKHGSDILQALPGSELACKELMQMAVQFLCARYPQYFRVVDGHTFVNHLLRTECNLATSEPLHVLLDNVPEDFAIVLRDHVSGRYYFRAGVICSAIGWNLGEKIGLSMSDVHQPVPAFKEKLAFSVDRYELPPSACRLIDAHGISPRFFAKFPTDRPIQRASWGFEIGQPLYLPSNHAHFCDRESQNPDLEAKDVFLRVDWQTLRRLPLSGAIAFNFKALFTSIVEFQDEAYVPSLALKVLNEGNPDIMKYKGVWHVEHVLKPTLNQYRHQQIQAGLIESQWHPRTLDESPFFPGWEKKYQRSETASSSELLSPTL
ncbi:hypothetical protein HIM_00766 [Hirsutella minnesotensis 3608]|nr:hypothetical protein HIM_00766 [Hirsutella minnesotensis 3608]